MPGDMAIEEYFEAGSAKNGVLPRAGYYVGYRVAALAARRYSLYQLAHLRGAALHRNVNRWLDELANHEGGPWRERGYQPASKRLGMTANARHSQCTTSGDELDAAWWGAK
jgi:hypothetical protein